MPAAARVESRDRQPTGVRVVRHLDLVILALALPIFLAAGFPLLGWGATALAWLGQRGIHHVLSARAAASDDPRTIAGLLAGSMIGRGWLVAGAILVVGLTTDSETGLSAAVLFLATFTVALTMALATGGAGTKSGASGRPRT